MRRRKSTYHSDDLERQSPEYAAVIRPLSPMGIHTWSLCRILIKDQALVRQRWPEIRKCDFELSGSEMRHRKQEALKAQSSSSKLLLLLKLAQCITNEAHELRHKLRHEKAAFTKTKTKTKTKTWFDNMPLLWYHQIKPAFGLSHLRHCMHFG
jgi:hypothetical protein